MFQLTQFFALKQSLNFQPLKAWPSILPLYAWGEELLCGFGETKPERAVLVFTGAAVEAAELFCQLHGELSLPELARLAEACPHFFNHVLPRYSFARQPGLKPLLSVIARLSPELQSWLTAKQIGPRDLAILPALNGLPVPILFNNLLTLEASRQTGLKILELGCELLMQGKVEIGPLSGETAEVWLKRLQALRYPQTTAQDDIALSKTRKLSWPKHVRGEYVRRGDEGHIEIKFPVRSARDLAERLKGLELVQQQMQEGWKQ